MTHNNNNEKKKIRVYICFGFFGRPSILLSLFSNSLHFSRDFVRNENSIPRLFTDFDNIKDFPWLFNKFPELEKIFFSLIFPWPRQPCCYKNTAGESEKRREKHQEVGRYLLLNIKNCSWQLAVNSWQTENKRICFTELSYLEEILECHSLHSWQDQLSE